MTNLLCDQLEDFTVSVIKLEGEWVGIHAGRLYSGSPRPRPLVKMVELCRGRHSGMSLIFDDEESIDEFLCDGDPNFLLLRAAITSLRGRRQSFVITIAQLTEYAHLAFPDFAPSIMDRYPIEPLINGVFTTEAANPYLTPYFGSSKVPPRCIEDLGTNPEAVYRLLAEGAQTKLMASIFDREPQELIEPVAGRMDCEGNNFHPTAFRTKHRMPLVFVPDDPSLESLPLVETFGMTRNFNYSEMSSYRNAEGLLYEGWAWGATSCGCVRTLKAPVPRSLPWDILAAFGV